MAKDSTKETPKNAMDNYILGASALGVLREGKVEEAGSLAQYAYAKRDAEGNYQIDFLGAMALVEFYNNPQQSGVGQRLLNDAGKFQEGLERATIAEVGSSLTGKLGWGKAVLEEVVKDGTDTTIKDNNERLKDLKYEQGQLKAKYEKNIRDAKDDKDKKEKLTRKYKDAQKALDDKYKQELRLAKAVSSAVNISLQRVASDAEIIGEYRGVLSQSEIEEIAEKTPGNSAADLY